MHGRAHQSADGNSHRARIRKVVRRVCAFIFALCFLSLTFRISIRDRYFPFQYNFYIPVIATLLLGAAAAASMPYAKHIRGACLSAILVLAAAGLSIDQPMLFAHVTIPTDSGFSVMEYNVKSYSWGEARLVRKITEANPDILCLTEGTFASRAPTRLKKEMGAEFSWAVGRTISIASRFRIRDSKQITDQRDVKILRAVVMEPSGPVAVYCVDFKTPNPFNGRNDRVAYDALYAAIADETLPAIVAGDFNTPRGSYYIARTMEGWLDPYESVSTRRILVTWPTIPIPMWQLDRQFCRQLKPLSADIPSVYTSDHFPLVVRYGRLD